MAKRWTLAPEFKLAVLQQALNGIKSTAGNCREHQVAQRLCLPGRTVCLAGAWAFFGAQSQSGHPGPSLARGDTATTRH